MTGSKENSEYHHTFIVKEGNVEFINGGKTGLYPTEQNWSLSHRAVINAFYQIPFCG